MVFPYGYTLVTISLKVSEFFTILSSDPDLVTRDLKISHPQLN